MSMPLTAWRGETLYVQTDIRCHPCPKEFQIRRYQIRMVETEFASWKGARTGMYGDALMPVDRAEVPAAITAIDVGVDALPGERVFTTAAGEPLSLHVGYETLPPKRLFPFYAEVNANDCLRAFLHFRGQDPDPTRSEDRLQMMVTKHAIDLARQFGIEPVKQSFHWFENPIMAPAVVRELMDKYAYVDLVFANAIAPPIIFCGSWDWNGAWQAEHPEVPYHPNATFLEEVDQAVAKAISEGSLAGAMAWCADEPRLPGDLAGMPVDVAIERVKVVLRHAPHLTPMITTGENSLQELRRLAGNLPIRYCVVQNHDRPDLLPGASKGSYFSCMAQGCATSKQSRPQRTDFPVAVVEGCHEADFQGAIRKAREMRAEFVLYYKVTKKLTTCWEKGGLFDDLDGGGNGDGTAMYVNESTGLVIPSVRMMHWHIAQQQVEKEMVLARGR